MSALYLVVGERANILGHGTVTVTSENSQWPKAALSDGDSSVYFMSDSLAASQIIKVDANHRYNAQGEEIAQGFEGPWGPDGAPVGWSKGTTGGGTVTEEGTIVHAGAKAVKLVASGTDAAFIWADFLVPSGWTFGARVWARSNLDGCIARVQDLNTGRYWVGPDDLGPPAGGWVTPQSDLAVIVGGSYAQRWIPSDGDAIPMVAEPYSLTGRDVTTVRIIIAVPANGPESTTYLDDFDIFCAVDFLSLHRTNLRYKDSLQLHSSLDDSAWTLRATMAGMQSQHLKLTRYLERYSRLTLIPPNIQASGAVFLEKPRICEMVLSQATNLLRPTQGLRSSWVQPQSRSGGGRFRLRNTERPHRTLELEFLHTEDVASFEQMRDEIYHRSGGGVFPVVVTWPKENEVPTATPTTDPANVSFGVLAEDLDLGKAVLPHYRQVLRIEEIPAPAPWFG